MTASEWPEWWSWEIEFSGHAVERMAERNVSETDVRMMLEEATSLKYVFATGRWAVDATMDREFWRVLIEPDRDARVILVVTAYRIGE